MLGGLGDEEWRGEMLLCLDIAFENIGWSIFDGKRPVALGLIHAPKSGKKIVRIADERADRCATMVGDLMGLVSQYEIPGIIGELPSGSQNAAAANLLGWAAGLVVSMCRILELPAEWVNQNDVKIATTGKKNATKHEIMDNVARRYGWERSEKVIQITKGKRKGKTTRQVTYQALGEKYPAGKFEHIADSIGVYWASRDRNLVRLFG